MTIVGLVMTMASTAQAQVVRFSGITDAVRGRFSNPATTAADPANPNRRVPTGIGFASGAGDWVVAGVPANLGTFGTNPTMSRTVDVSAKRLTSLTMSLTVNLSAFATATSGSATLALTGADVTVQLVPIPLS